MRTTRQAAVMLAAAAISTTAIAADYVSPLVGGGGGVAYTRDCGANAALVGLQARFGLWIDQLTPVCQSIGSTGTLGQIFTQARIGGSGGATARESRCHPGRVVSGVYVRWGTYIDRIRLECATWDPAAKSPLNDDLGLASLGNLFAQTAGEQENYCPAGQVAKGLKGKAAMYVDSMALICNVWNQ